MFSKLFFKLQLFRYNLQRKNSEFLCHAPYSSLYFDYKGNVYACFANKHMVLGRYDKEEIKDIWNGRNINILRNSLENRTFDNGCHLCRNKIYSGNFSHCYAKRYDYLTPVKAEFPGSVEVQLSNHCNLSCTMCVVRKDEKSLTDIGKFKKNFETLIPHLKNASFSGGEPFLIDDYFDIWESFCKLNPECRISVNTNATILDDKVRSILSRLHFNLSVSVDGFSKECFENIRVNASRDTVYKNLEYFMEYTTTKGTFFNVKTCILNQNINEFPEIFDYFTKNNIPLLLNEVVFPLRSALWNNSSVKLESIITMLEKRSPAFDLSDSGNHNRQLWIEMIRTLKKYKRDSEKFEKEIWAVKPTEKELTGMVTRRLLPFFINSDELSVFMKIIQDSSGNKQNRMQLLYFFTLVPFERIIGEMEIRNENEISSILKTIRSDFNWQLP